MSQLEIRMFAMYQEPATLPDAEIEAMTFQQTLAAALEHGLKRFDRKLLAKLSGIHYPHFAEYMAGKRELSVRKLDKFCMYCGCDYPNQWLAIQRCKEREEYKAQSAAVIADYVMKSMARAA